MTYDSLESGVVIGAQSTGPSKSITEPSKVVGEDSVHEGWSGRVADWREVMVWKQYRLYLKLDEVC